MPNLSPDKHTILILGASGFIGNALYKELLSYFKTYGTYFRQEGNYGDNQVFFKYDAANQDIHPILEQTQPTVIISALDGPHDAVLTAHRDIAQYVQSHHYSRILYLSSVHVFDAKRDHPSYENDTPKTDSDFGKHKLAIEQLLLEQIPAQTTILRLPLVLGVNAPRIVQLIQASKHKAAYEVYPNLVVSVTTVDKIAQQVHFIINQDLDGIYHLASEDVIHHNDLIAELCEKITDEPPLFKNVYQRNEDSYLAILPKINPLPPSYRITIAEVIDDCTLKEEISTFRS
ncbi:MAG: sugar nucleotide-binding protein [Marinirhabdus sp.]|nr:sugar nucleotide-binding protein [Marinirhabdus sp.]